MTQSKNKLRTIGVTGGSGSGKSLVSSILAEHGAYVIDADAINHKNLMPGGSAYAGVVDEFGKTILSESGTIDRRRLGEIVFSSKERLKALELITHGEVVSQIHKLIRHANDSTTFKFIVVDAPLLVEAGLHRHMDEVWLVVADQDLRLERICARDCITKDMAMKRLAAGTAQEVLLEFADVIISNTKDVSELRNEVSYILDIRKVY